MSLPLKTGYNYLNVVILLTKRKLTYSGIESGGLAGVIVSVAFWIRAAVDSNGGGELACGAQRRVWGRRSGL